MKNFTYHLKMKHSLTHNPDTLVRYVIRILKHKSPINF